MLDKHKYHEGFGAMLALSSAFDHAEKLHGPTAFDPHNADLSAPGLVMLRQAGERLDRFGGKDAMFSAACALAQTDPRRFYGIGVLLGVVWAGIGDWPLI
ncbi:hypothetical protein [Phaeobacter inhibens]|uniref:hypothetical protein n=1 Tax=Phaeobacter inhibens TaxID=221822 RepID=UPI000C9CFD7D|nr:hypothetical protein [Phaeobacter inhibens]